MITELLNLLTPEVLLGGLVIFLLRLIDQALDTLRMLFVVRGKRAIVWILGVITNIIYIMAISNVLTGKNNPVTILCYAVGYATGNILGMRLEERLAIGFREINVISKNKGHQIASGLRELGYGVTEMVGQGMEGTVEMLKTNVKRKQAKEVRRIIEMIDNAAFITEDDFVPVNAGGYWHK